MTTAERWNAMSPAVRLKLIRKDKSMRAPQWAGLALAMSTTSFETLSRLQRDAVVELVTRYAPKACGHVFLNRAGTACAGCGRPEL